MRTVHLAVKMTIHMKCQLIFMKKKKKKKIDWCLLQILLGALRVNFTLSLVQFSVNSPEPIWTLRKNVQKLSKSIHIVQFLFLFVCVLVPQSKTLQTMIKGSWRTGWTVLRHDSRNKGMKHSWKNIPSFLGIEPGSSLIKIQCSNHWAKESTPWRSC